MAYTETTTTSWSSRLGSSFSGMDAESVSLSLDTKRTGRFYCLLTLLLLVFLSLPVCTSLAAEREKVLLDTDMVEFFDDGVAMILLAKSPKVDLLGVTTLSGNSWVEEGTAYTIRQLELVGLADIPVAMGLSHPFRPQRHELFELERITQGMGHDAWLGSFGFKQPADWQKFYHDRYGKKPAFLPIKQHAVDFIIDTVRANPGQVTIAAIGPVRQSCHGNTQGT